MGLEEEMSKLNYGDFLLLSRRSLEEILGPSNGRVNEPVLGKGCFWVLKVTIFEGSGPSLFLAVLNFKDFYTKREQKFLHGQTASAFST